MQMNNMEMISILSVVANVVVAIFLAYVTYQNYKINSYNSNVQKDNLRLALFERRYLVYEGIKEFITFVLREGKVDYNSIATLGSKTRDGEFLFGSEVKGYIDNLREKGFKLKSCRRKLADRTLPIGDERNKLAEEEEQLLIWFGNQHEEIMRIFRKYLKFSIVSSKKCQLISWLKNNYGK